VRDSLVQHGCSPASPATGLRHAALQELTSDDKISDDKISDDKISDDKISDAALRVLRGRPTRTSDDKISDDKISDDCIGPAAGCSRGRLASSGFDPITGACA
jgi:hypothetical protein